MQIQPYLFFDGRGDEAINFYKSAAGAEVEMLVRFKDSPETDKCTPVMLDKIMHAHLRIGGATVLLSDGHCEGKTNFQGFALALTVPTEAQADKVFAALGAGGQVQMPLAKTFFSPRFGMLTDRFGVEWMIMVPKV